MAALCNSNAAKKMEDPEHRRRWAIERIFSRPKEMFIFARKILRL